MNLTSPVNATVLDGQGVVTINNDDGAPTAGLVAAYGFNENTGTTTADASGNNLTGTIAGATWTTAGKNGNALTLRRRQRHGVGRRQRRRSTSTRVTLMAWVRPTTLGELAHGRPQGIDRRPRLRALRGRQRCRGRPRYVNLGAG